MEGEAEVAYSYRKMKAATKTGAVSAKTSWRGMMQSQEGGVFPLKRHVTRCQHALFLSRYTGRVGHAANAGRKIGTETTAKDTHQKLENRSSLTEGFLKAPIKLCMKIEKTT